MIILEQHFLAKDCLSVKMTLPLQKNTPMTEITPQTSDNDVEKSSLHEQIKVHFSRNKVLANPVTAPEALKTYISVFDNTHGLLSFENREVLQWKYGNLLGQQLVKTEIKALSTLVGRYQKLAHSRIDTPLKGVILLVIWRRMNKTGLEHGRADWYRTQPAQLLEAFGKKELRPFLAELSTIEHRPKMLTWMR